LKALTTVTVTVAIWAPLCARTVVVPGFTPVTTPFASTVAIAGSLDVHVTIRPVSTLLKSSFSVAVSVLDCPAPSVTAVGSIVIVRTCAVPAVTSSVSAQLALPPSCGRLAITFTAPAARATTFTHPPCTCVAPHPTVQGARSAPPLSSVKRAFEATPAPAAV
jgi:hypothetical protein